MSHIHHIKASQDIHHHAEKEEKKELSPEMHMSNSKKHQLVNMIPISSPGKNMGHSSSKVEDEYLEKVEKTLNMPSVIMNNNIPTLTFAPMQDCKKCLGTGYSDKNGNVKICKLCAEKAGKCLKCGGTGMKSGGKNCNRCTKL
jgi:hypothetical protein